MLTLTDIYLKSHNGELLTQDEAWRLYSEAPLAELAAQADMLRQKLVPDPSVVTWQIDRNVNTTNVCTSGCLFCNFHCKPHQTEKHFIYEILFESANSRILLCCYYAEHCTGSGFDGLFNRDVCNRNSLLVSLCLVLLWNVACVYQSFCPNTKS